MNIAVSVPIQKLPYANARVGKTFIFDGSYTFINPKTGLPVPPDKAGFLILFSDNLHLGYSDTEVIIGYTSHNPQILIQGTGFISKEMHLLHEAMCRPLSDWPVPPGIIAYPFPYKSFGS